MVTEKELPTQAASGNLVLDLAEPPIRVETHFNGELLMEAAPNADGQFLFRKFWGCGHVTLECAKGRERMDADRLAGVERDCHKCVAADPQVIASTRAWLTRIREEDRRSRPMVEA